MIGQLCRYAGSSSDSDDLSDEEEDGDDGSQDLGAAASTPLAAFLSFKQEADRTTGFQGSLEHGGKVPRITHRFYLGLEPRGRCGAATV